jgi:hypothetical protein
MCETRRCVRIRRMIAISVVLFGSCCFFVAGCDQRSKKTLDPNKASTKSSENKADAKKKPSESNGARTFPEGAVEIITIPSGLKIYLSPDDGQSPKPTDRNIPVVGSHPVVSERYLKGVAPLIVRDLVPGKYLLAVSPTILIRNKVFQPPADPWLDARTFVSANFLESTPRLEGDVEGAVVYSVMIERRAHTRIVVLAVPTYTSMEASAKLYPAGAIFDVDEEKFAGELKERTKETPYRKLLSESNLRMMVDLLRRGGKASAYEGDLGILAAVREDGGLDFVFKVRIDGSWRLAVDKRDQLAKGAAQSLGKGATHNASAKECSIVFVSGKAQPGQQVVKMDRLCAFVCKTDDDCARGRCTRKGIRVRGISKDIAPGKKVEDVHFCSLDVKSLE